MMRKRLGTLVAALAIVALPIAVATAASADPPSGGNFGQCQAAAAQLGLDLGTERAPGQTQIGPSVVDITLDTSTNPPTFTAVVHGPLANDNFAFLFACSYVHNG